MAQKMAVAGASKTVVGTFSRLEDARAALEELDAAGFPRDDVSIIAHKHVVGTVSGKQPAVETDTRAQTAADAGMGAALGGIGGLLFGFAALTVPGVGPIMAAGPILAGLSGLGLGAVAGGLIGALTESGVPEEEAHYYAESVRRGDVLVTVKTEASRAERAQEILDANGAADVDARLMSWRNRGWTAHNPGAEPLSADELRRERELYGTRDHLPEVVRTEPEAEGGALEGTHWPHRTAGDIGQRIPVTTPDAASTPANVEGEPLEDEYVETGSVIGQAVRPLNSDVDTPSNFSDAIENNRRRPVPAVVHAERGFERAKESASRSARRLARIYEAKHKVR